MKAKVDITLTIDEYTEDVGVDIDSNTMQRSPMFLSLASEILS